MYPDYPLAAFELPRSFVTPMLEACRLFNTAFDALFYDVATLRADLGRRGETIAWPGSASGADKEAAASVALDLGALKNPEGSILVINAATAPWVQSFDDVKTFLRSRDPAVRAARTAAITGVGSSALGSAALAWNVSQAIGEPVLAIVPGYGVADFLLQGLGGWFGFGLYDALETKARVQTALAAVAPDTARIGRRLSNSAPGSRTLPNGGPVFRTGCGSSDVLHAILLDRPLGRVVGHSKGALAIANALADLPAGRTQGLSVITLGCPLAQTLPGVRYHQFLGLFDALGALNSWGNRPNRWEAADHSTNTRLPLSLDARDLVAEGAANS